MEDTPDILGGGSLVDWKMVLYCRTTSTKTSLSHLLVVVLRWVFSHSMSTKMSIAADDKAFYYMTRDSLCFLVMAESRYPKRLAFLYLDEIGDLVLGELLREFGNQVGCCCCCRRRRRIDESWVED